MADGRSPHEESLNFDALLADEEVTPRGRPGGCRGTQPRGVGSIFSLRPACPSGIPLGERRSTTRLQRQLGSDRPSNAALARHMEVAVECRNPDLEGGHRAACRHDRTRVGRAPPARRSRDRARRRWGTAWARPVSPARAPGRGRPRGDSGGEPRAHMVSVRSAGDRRLRGPPLAFAGSCRPLYRRAPPRHRSRLAPGARLLGGAGEERAHVELGANVFLAGHRNRRSAAISSRRDRPNPGA